MTIAVRSIQAKIALAITLTFLVVLAVSVVLTARGERELALAIATDKARDVGRNFFDGVNTMMLTGSLEQMENLKGKLMAEGSLRDLRIVNTPGAIPGLSKETPPADELDRRATQGAEVIQTGNDANGRTVTVLTPIRASGNYLGTNCLSCHQVAEGTVVAAVRVTYSLAKLDAQIRQKLTFNSLANLVLYALGIGLLLFMLRRVVILPLLAMRQVMGRIEADSDLTHRLPVHGGCEVGQLGEAINGMLDKFRASLTQVAETSQRVTGAADHIASVATETTQAASQQRAETDRAVSHMADLKALALDVGNSARETADASVEADRDAQRSNAMTREAIGGILGLVREIDHAAVAIEKLDERSNSVSDVLNVIRGIAEQTNLLALNAAIEAARAGEAGRGFAVVADEVRKLATLSHDSTRSIEEIVNQLQREAKDAVRVMGGARDSATRHGQQLESAAASLDQIVARVTDIRELNTRMAQAVQRQSELTEDVGTRILAVNEIADRTADQAAQTGGVSGDLVTLARELNGLVGRFKLN